MHCFLPGYCDSVILSSSSYNMDQKQGKPKNKIFEFLPKAASGVYFHNPPYSPTRDKRLENAAKLKAHCRRGFSGPLMIPDDVRRKPRTGSFDDHTQEDDPTSPKVSCMGQIKHKKQIKKIKRASINNLIPKDVSKPPAPWSPREIKKHGFAFRRMFSSVNPARKSDSINVNGGVDHHNHDHDRTAPRLPDRAPSLSQMKRFESGRGNAFANFDINHHDCSDEERGDSDGEEDVRIAFSAPLVVGGDQFHQVPLQPRKEINIWKRRTMAAPRPLELKPMVRAN